MALRQPIAILLVFCYISGISFGQEQRDMKDDNGVVVASFVDTMFYGTGIGAGTGLSAGWVRYADRHEMQNVWQSVGYGALGGVGLGLTAAILGKNGSGIKALRDIDMAGGFGGGFGFTWGIISALFTGDSRRIASSVAWGHLGGIVLGLGIAGYKLARQAYTVEDENAPRYSVRLTGNPGPDGCLTVKVEKRF